MTGPLVEACAHCDGRGWGWVTDPDADGGKVMAPCEGCDSTGKVVLCAEALCGERFPYPEAAREGVFCGACRQVLDAADHDEERPVRIAS